MKLVYIVEGKTGTYEDRYSWICKIFNDLEKAEDFVNVLQCAADEAEEIGRAEGESYGFEYFVKDENLKKYIRSIDYNGVRFDINEAEFEE